MVPLNNPRAAPLMVLLVFTLITSAMPVEALHLTAFPEAPQIDNPAEDFPPDTGFGEVDDRLKELREQHRQTVEGLNREFQALWGTLADPPVTSSVPLLNDTFEPGARHGGLGNWTTRTVDDADPGSGSVVGDGWQLLQQEDGNWSRAFTTPGERGYAQGADMILLSPQIDLGTLGHLREIIPAQRGDQMDSAYHPFYLLIRHKFSFATDPEVGPYDGGRVEIFQTPVKLDEGKHISPVDMAGTASGQGERGTAVFDDDPAFSGTSDWRVDAFNLTGWAGMKIRLGFHVKTQDLGPSIFDPESDEFPNDAEPGWVIDHAEVRAPALQSRVVVGETLSPQPLRHKIGIPEPAPGPVTFQVPIWNLGAEETTVDVDWQVERQGTSEHRPEPLGRDDRTFELAPGEVRVLTATANVPPVFSEGCDPDDEGDACPDLAAEDADGIVHPREIVWFNVTARPPGQDARLQDAEAVAQPDPGRRSIPAWVHRVDNLANETRVTPSVAMPDVPRTLEVTLDNRGNAPEEVRVEALANLNDTDENVNQWFTDHRHQNLTVPPQETVTTGFNLTIPEVATVDVTASLSWWNNTNLSRDWHNRTLTVASGTTQDKVLDIRGEDLRTGDSVDTSWRKVTVDIDDATEETRFRWDQGEVSGQHWMIDDVVISDHLGGEVFSDDFDDDTNGLDDNWADHSNVSADEDCGSTSGSNSLHFNGEGLRRITTETLDVSNGGSIEFFLKPGTAFSGPCNSKGDHPLYLNYSTGNGWNQLAAYPDGPEFTVDCDNEPGNNKGTEGMLDEMFACRDTTRFGSPDGWYWKFDAADNNGGVIKGHPEAPEGLDAASNVLVGHDGLLGLGRGGPSVHDRAVAGFANLSLDLIYSAPPESMEIRFHVRAPLDPVPYCGRPFNICDNTVNNRQMEGTEQARSSLHEVSLLFPPRQDSGPCRDCAVADIMHESWHHDRIDVDRLLSEGTGLQDTWHLGLEEVVISTAEREDIQIDDLKLTGVPIAEPQRGRQTLLHTPGQCIESPAERVEEYDDRCIQVHEREARDTVADVTDSVVDPVGPLPLVGDPSDDVRNGSTGIHPADCRTLLSGPARDGKGQWQVCNWVNDSENESSDAWQLEDGPGGGHAWGSGGGSLFMTTPQPFSPMENPVLEIHHKYTGGAQPISTDEIKIQALKAVFVQFQPAGCTDCPWSDLHWIEPVGGYPTPFLQREDGVQRSVDTSSGISPGEGFYAAGTDAVPKTVREGHVMNLPKPDPPGWQSDRFLLTPDALDGRDISGERARFLFQVQGHQGRWSLGGFQVYDEPAGLDLQVGPVEVQPAYNLSRLEAVGPGSAVPVRVQVNNTGALDVQDAELGLRVHETESEADCRAGGASQTMRSTISLASGASTNETFMWTVPESAQGGWVCLTAEVDIPGEEDQDPWDNTFPREGRRGPDAPNEDVPALPVRGIIDLETRQRVAPRDAPTGVTRSTVVELRNHGNTPATDVEVTRVIDQTAGSIVRVREDTWTLPKPLQPGESWVRLDDPMLSADHQARFTDQPAFQWTPDTAGRHKITAEITGPGERTGTLADNLDVRVDNVQDPVFSDGFDQVRQGGAGTYETLGQALWHERDGAGFRSAKSLWVGGTEAGYPDDANASIKLPTVDLTRARSAALSFMTTYDTEPGYDGGIVEASTDGGRTWHPLVAGTVGQDRGYPSSLAGSNPAVSGLTPTDARAGFSGSTGSQGALDGWQAVNIPLDQIPGFSVPETLADLRPPGTPDGSVQVDGPAYYWPTWVTGEAARLERFEVYNGTLAEPNPRGGGQMWYSGTQGDTTENDQGQSMEVDTTLNITVVSSQDLDEKTIQFWDWRDGVTRFDRSGTGGTFTVSASNGSVERSCLSLARIDSLDETESEEWEQIGCVLSLARDASGEAITDGGWTLRNLTFEAPLNSALTLGFTYDSQAPAQAGNRGWAIDGVRILKTGGQGPAEILRGDLDEGAPGVTIDISRAGECDADHILEVEWTQIGSMNEYKPPEATCDDGEEELSGATAPGLWTATRDGDSGELVWSLTPEGGRLSFPPNMDTRLVSPVIDLAGVPADNATFEMEHRWEFTSDYDDADGTMGDHGVEGGAVEIQVLNQTTGAWDPWRVLLPRPVDFSKVALCNTPDGECLNGTQPAEDSQDDPEPNREIFPFDDESVMGERLSGSLEPYTVGVRNPLEDPDNRFGDGVVAQVVPPTPPIETNWWWKEGATDSSANLGRIHLSPLITGDQPTWTTSEFDLSTFIGERVRLAFHAWSNPLDHDSDTSGEEWQIRDARVDTRVLEGGPVDLRLAFGSDGSVGGHGWGVDEMRVGTLDYARNLALRFDASTMPSTIAPGQTLWLNGTVENRGSSPRSGFGVRLAPVGDAFGLEIESVDEGGFHDRPAGPFALAPGGQQGSTRPFSFRVHVEESAPEQRVNLTLHLSRQPEHEAPRLRDEVGGNKEATFAVNVSDHVGFDLDLEASPIRTHAGSPINLATVIENTGPWPTEPAVWVNVTRDRDVVWSWNDRVPLDRGERRPVPPQGLDVDLNEPGAYRVVVEAVDGTVTARNHTTFHVGTVMRAEGHGFNGSSLEPWTADTVPSREWCQQPEAFQQPPAQAPHQWSTTNTTSNRGNGSAVFGNPPGQGAYQDFSDSGLVSPRIDASSLPDRWLALSHQPHFGPGDGAIVEMRFVDPVTERTLFVQHDADEPGERNVWNCDRHSDGQPNVNGWFLLTPEQGYDSGTESTAAITNQGGVAVDGRYSTLGVGHPVLGGESSRWQPLSFDIGSHPLVTPEGEPLTDRFFEDHLVQFRLRATTQAHEREGSGWLVDDATVTAHAVQVDSVEQLPLTDGAGKTYTFDVANPSPLDDIYDVAIDWNRTTIPREYAEILTPTLDLPAGSTGVARVAVEIPVDAPAPSGEYHLVVEARSQADRFMADSAVLTLDVETVPHPDLVSRLETSGNQLEIGSTTTLGAVIANAGDVESPSTTARFFIARPDGSDRQVISEVDVPPIPATGSGGSPQTVVSTNWTVPRDELGSFEVGVDVDPADRAVELNESNNHALATVEVVPLQRPDLQILPTDIEVLDVTGRPITSTEPFDLVQVTGTVRNVGNQPANNVRVNVFTGASLTSQTSVDTVPAGAQETVAITLFAPGNTTQLTLAAVTSDVELREDNNEAGTTLLVEEGTVDTTISRDNLTLEAGRAPTTLTLDLENTGNRPLLLNLRAVEPAVEVTLDPGTLALVPGEVATATVTLKAGPGTPAGTHDLLLAAEHADGRDRTLVPVEVTVPRRVAHEITPLTATATPAQARLPVTVENTGNVADELLLSANSEAWPAGEPIRLALDPGDIRRPTIEMNVPSDTPPGTYPVLIDARSRAGFNATVPIELTVQPNPLVDVDVEPEAAGGARVAYALTFTNPGNVPVTPFASPAAQPSGWDATLHAPATQLDPGERSQGRLILEPTGEPAPGVFQAPIELELASPEGGDTQPRVIQVTVDARPPSLTVSNLDRTPRFDVTAGDQVTYRATVDNQGSGPAAPVELRLFVDDELVDQASVDEIPGHDARTVNLTYDAEPGEHAVVLAVDPREVIQEFNETDNAVSFVLDISSGPLGALNPLPGPGLWAALAVVAAVAWIRRPKR